MVAYAVLASAVLFSCWVFGWAFGRWSVENRSIKVEVNDGLSPEGLWRSRITVRNDDRRAVGQLIVVINVLATGDSTLSAHLMHADTKNPPRLHTAERGAQGESFRGSTFIYTAEQFQPRDSLKLAVTSSEPLIELYVRASCAIVSDTYQYPPYEGEWVAFPTVG